MRLTLKFFAIVAFTVFAYLALAFGYEVNHRRTEKQLPRTGWVAGFHSYHGRGYDSAPVQVISVRSNITDGLVGVGLKNHSDKDVRAITLAWYVSEAQGTGQILTEGQTAELKLSLPDQTKLNVNTPSIRWDDVLRPLVRNESLKGDYDIWIVVRKVVYDDGSIWNFSPPGNVARVTGKQNAHFESGCANQTCKKNGDVYQCVDGQGELCTNHGQECTSSICGSEIN